MAAPAPTIYGPIHKVNTAARILQESDSTGALDGDSRHFFLLHRALFALAAQSPGGPKPMHWNTGVSSTGMDSQLTRIQTAITKYAPITNFWWCPGIFDIVGSGHLIGTVNDTVSSTWLGAFNLVTQLVAGTYGIPMYIVGPHFVGEKWPSGQNTGLGHDADVDALDAGMITIVQRLNAQLGGGGLITYRSNRQTLYADLEPIYNLPAPGIAAGPFTRPDGANEHFNPAGHWATYQYHQQDVRMSAARQPNQVAVYSSTTPPNAASIGIDYDPASLVGVVANGANVTTWNNSPLGGYGSAANLVNASATKPTFANPGDGSNIGGAPAVNFGGAAWLKTNAFGTKPNPFMTAFLFKPANLTTSMIWIDGLNDDAATQEPYLATILTSGVVEVHAGNAFDNGKVTAGHWHTVIVYWSGSNLANANSYVVIDGHQFPLGNAGTTGRTGRILGASAAAGLIANGLVGRMVEWDSELGALPNWYDVQNWLTTQYGVTPQ